MENKPEKLQEGIVCFCTLHCKESMRIFRKDSNKQVATVRYRERGGFIFKTGYDQKLIVRDDGRLEIQERQAAPSIRDGQIVENENECGRYGNLWKTVEVLPEGDYYGINQDGQRVETLDGDVSGW